MSRLADRLLQVGPQAPPHLPAPVRAAVAQDLRQDVPGFRAFLRDAELFAVDNVVDYFFAGTPQEYWAWERDFPCLAPPFDVFWLETRRPARMVSEVRGEMPMRLEFRAWGALARGCKWQSQPAADRARWLETLPELPCPPHWVLSLYLFGETRKFRIYPLGECTLFLDEGGRALHVNDGRRSTIQHRILAVGEKARWALEAYLSTMLLPFGLAISFLHCRNVHLIERRPPAALAKAHARKHGQPLLRYHVLEIEPMKRVLRTEGRSGEVGLQHALHICRGHFKDFRERGLFGKHRGVYWWDHHVRGNSAFGVVAKDYAVRQPAAAPGGAI